MLTRRLRAGHYDVVVCLNVGVAYAVCSLWALIPLRLAVLPNFCGRAYRLAARLWSAVEPHRGDRLIQDTYLALLAQLGVGGGSRAKEVHAAPGADDKVRALLAADGRPLVGIGVSSANKLKELGTEKVAAVAAGLLARNPELRVVLIGGDADREQAGAVMAAVADPERLIDTTGRFALAELPALLARLSAYVGVDSGVTYMTDAVGIPLVSVAGPCNMAETRPLGRHVVIIQRELPCAPCAHIFHAPYRCRTGTHACTKEVAGEGDRGRRDSPSGRGRVPSRLSAGSRTCPTLHPEKILVIRRDNIGDLVCTTPMIRMLRRHYPDAWIAALVTRYNAEVLAGNPDLDAVFAYQKAEAPRRRARAGRRSTGSA